MKRLKKRTISRKKSTSPIDMVSIIIESIIVLSLGLGFLGISLGIGAIQIVLLLLIDIAILVILSRKSFSNELIALLFTLLLFIGPLKFVGSIIIFTIILLSVLKKARVY